jgi:hypothetical protein
VNVTEEKLININEFEAKELASRYKIDKLPVVMIRGDIDKIQLKGYESFNDTLVFRDIKAPYYDLKDGQVKGLVKVTIIKPRDCDKCTDLGIIKTQLENVGVKINEYKTLQEDEEEAKNIIGKYGIDRLPTMLVSKDLAVYEIAKAWLNVGTITDDGNYLLTKMQPPYYDLKEKKIKGLVNLNVVYDKGCLECQDKVLQENALKSIGIFFADKKEYDLNENGGRELIKKYGITKLPIVVMSKEASDYNGIDQLWKQAGTREEDGSYVLRNAELFGTYKDLKSGEVVKAKEE